MPVGFDSIRAGAAGAAGGYEIDYAVSLDTNRHLLKATGDFVGAGQSAYFTLSFWWKLGVVNSGAVFASDAGGGTYYADRCMFAKSSTHKHQHACGTNASAFYYYNGTTVYNDTVDWHHTVIRNSNNTWTRWEDGVQTESYTHPHSSFRQLIRSGYDFRFNSQEYQSTPAGNSKFDLAEFALILDSSFGSGDIYDYTQFGEDVGGAWVPKEPSLLAADYGADGFLLEFKQNGVSGHTSSDIGADTSGQGNHIRLVGTWSTAYRITDTPTS